MEAFVRFTNESQGRDRIFRAAQYACMLLRFLLENKTDKEKVVMKLKEVESNLSSGRKLFRLGNVVHALEATRKAARYPDYIARFLLTIANLNRALYFVCDNALWLKSVGLTSDINKEKWRQRAAKFYYYSLLMALARDVYEIFQRMEQKSSCEKKTGDCSNHPHDQHHTYDGAVSFYSFFVSLYCTLRNHPTVLLDTTKNLCDLFSPLDQLGIYKTNAGVIGLCGLISSLVGILTLARPQLKIK